MLTLRIKPNDEISLKYAILKYRSKDPHYEPIIEDLIHFRARTVVVTFTEIKTRFNKNGSIDNFYHYIHVKDRAGIEACFPIEFIDRNRNLKRDHKRISLHNKILICA